MPRTLLIIEDDPMYAEILSAMLKMRRWEPVAALSMSAAWELLKTRAFDATILDLALPDSDTGSSLDLIPLLKAKGAGRVIIITGAVITPPMSLVAQLAGADGIMSKNELRLDGSLSRMVGL